MEEASTFFKIFTIASLISGTIFSCVVTFFLSSKSNKNSFFPIYLSLPAFVFVIASVGIPHGFLTTLFLVWLGIDSIIKVLASSVFAVGILSLAICSLMFIISRQNNLTTLNAPGNSANHIRSLGVLLKISVFLSVFLSIPALLIGFFIKLILPFFDI